MNDFNTELEQRLADIRRARLYRELRTFDSPQSRVLTLRGKSFLNFSSNDYLGLANEPALKQAAIKAVERFGAGAGASRLISGSLSPHTALEERLAAFKNTPAALAFNSGYAAAHGAIGALMGKDDIVVVDKLIHACIIDAVRLCGATLRVFAHNDLNDLEHILNWAAARMPKPNRHTLVVTESVFSMDGDHAPLRALVDLKDRYGAWLMVDEAHATGLYGPNRRGLAEQLGVAERIEVQMGTLGKALGAAGGFICGPRALIDLLVNRARPFIFSTAPAPAVAAAATAGIDFLSSPAGQTRRQLLWENVAQLSRTVGTTSNPSAIIPLRIGDEDHAVASAAKLRECGLFIPAIRYPAVARGSARLRLTVTAAHSREDISTLASSLRTLELVPQPPDCEQEAVGQADLLHQRIGSEAHTEGIGRSDAANQI